MDLLHYGVLSHLLSCIIGIAIVGCMRVLGKYGRSDSLRVKMIMMLFSLLHHLDISKLAQHAFYSPAQQQKVQETR